MTDKERQKAELKIMNRLNENRAFYRHLFDCGDLGFALVEWFHRWEITWFGEAELL